MRLSTTLVSLASAAGTLAYPGMGKVMEEIEARDEMLKGRSIELIGDLISGAYSPAGQAIKGILQGFGIAVADKTQYKAPGALGSDACKKDKLCMWKYLADEMYAVFADSEGCTDLARGAIRLGFHDAGSWDRKSPNGGADGSILLAGELSRPENFGLETIGSTTMGWYTKYKPYGAGMADIIQLGANVGVVACPDGPRIRTFVGRPDSSKPAPDGKLPSVHADAQSLIDLFAAKTFTATDLVALVGAHTASKQRFVDPSRAGAAQDSTPHYWDTSFYSETLDAARGISRNATKTADPEEADGTDNDGPTATDVFVFQSDKNLAVYSKTKIQWAIFAGKLGKPTWALAYASSYFRMSMLGVKNLNSLTEISKVLPLTRT
ncbi:heme peroxidase [Microdochium trichocladiopsis]|uniref:Peroxidase n=1 Tax=Microdochium trichocladiopsis TaxID=1682393 RepID=A0A9P8YIC0_9PEZI|nr:heme peroxidase [Microdochium trichocladiopsis]KAH7040924.1 heme peroxidase [Microdochium trichocladiopsis]